jgi:hypothetical protein
MDYKIPDKALAKLRRLMQANQLAAEVANTYATAIAETLGVEGADVRLDIDRGVFVLPDPPAAAAPEPSQTEPSPPPDDFEPPRVISPASPA